MNTMKPTLSHILLTIAVSMCVERCLSQGFGFQNIGPAGRAAIYGPDPNDPRRQQWGNALDASPPGTQTYAGPGLAGTNFSVEAWYSLTPVLEVFQLAPGATPVARSLTRFFELGYFVSGDRTIPDAVFNPNTNPPFLVYLQVRAWDNGGGQFSSWADAWNAAQAGSGNAVGWSKVFEQPLDWGAVPWPSMVNFESFNIFIVPEPSTVSLAVLGGAALLWRIDRSRRKRRE